MHNNSWLRRGLFEACLLGAALAVGTAGCGANSPDGSAARTDASGGGTARTASPLGPAVNLVLSDDEALAVEGAIDAPLDVVVYAVSGLDVGDELTVRVEALTQGFNPALAVFDSDGNWMDFADDGGAGTTRLDGGVDFVVRRATAQTYVVVSSSVRADSTGDFRLTVLRSGRRSAVPQPSGQRIFLNFDGQDEVQIGARPPVNVPAFSGNLIAPEYADATAELRQRVTARVRRDFAGLGMEIVASHEAPPPAPPYSTLYFGSYDPALLGVADSVDIFNAVPEQDAIVFVDTFSVFASLHPTVEELADALANVASHEIGHLVGLHHTADAADLMDITASLNEMLNPQSFNRAPLNVDTFPTGYQDAPALLSENLGGELLPSSTAAFRRLVRANIAGSAVSARATLRFGTGCR